MCKGANDERNTVQCPDSGNRCYLYVCRRDDCAFIMTPTVTDPALCLAVPAFTNTIYDLAISLECVTQQNSDEPVYDCSQKVVFVGENKMRQGESVQT